MKFVGNAPSHSRVGGKERLHLPQISRENEDGPVSILRRHGLHDGFECFDPEVTVSPLCVCVRVCVCVRITRILCVRNLSESAGDRTCVHTAASNHIRSRAHTHILKHMRTAHRRERIGLIHK